MEYITTLEEYNAAIAKAKQEGAKEEREKNKKEIMKLLIPENWNKGKETDKRVVAIIESGNSRIGVYNKTINEVLNSLK